MRKAVLAGIAWPLLAAAPFLLTERPVARALQVPRPPSLPPQKEASRNEPAPSRIPAVRVLLTAQPIRSIRLQGDGPYRVLAADGRLLAEGLRLPPQMLEATGNGFRLGQKAFRGSSFEVVPQQEPSLWVGERQYRGRLRVVRRPGRLMIAVNAIDVEDYVASVLNGEMSDDFPPAARRAQAIIARSYALYQMKTFGATADYDLMADTRSQLYQGVQYRGADNRRWAVENAGSRLVADETRGLVCTHRGRLFCTYYSAICGGQTTDGRAIFPDAAAPLVSLPCNWCQGSKYYRWQADISKARVEADLRRLAGPERVGKLQQIQVLPAAQPGWVPQVRVWLSGRAWTVSSYAFRLRVGEGQLRSPYFSVDDRGAVWHFAGRGWGHGVGLCQWGARGQAVAGRTTAQILQYYYPGSELTAVR